MGIRCHEMNRFSFQQTSGKHFGLQTIVSHNAACIYLYVSSHAGQLLSPVSFAGHTAVSLHMCQDRPEALCQELVQTIPDIFKLVHGIKFHKYIAAPRHGTQPSLKCL